jgi:E3 ubiquitin-protein ligase HERC2
MYILLAGRGGSESCKSPRLVSTFRDTDVEIARVYCGAQFSVALSKEGKVYTWGKGEHYRLGHGSEEHVRYPKLVEALNGKVVTALGVGSMHVIAITEDAEVYGWGRNEQGQLGDLCGSSITEPTLLQCLKGRSLVGISCGPSQVCASIAPLIQVSLKLFA